MYSTCKKKVGTFLCFCLRRRDKFNFKYKARDLTISMDYMDYKQMDTYIAGLSLISNWTVIWNAKSSKLNANYRESTLKIYIYTGHKVNNSSELPPNCLTLFICLFCCRNLMQYMVQHGTALLGRVLDLLWLTLLADLYISPLTSFPFFSSRLWSGQSSLLLCYWNSINSNIMHCWSG